MKPTVPSSVALTGTDKFILALEHQHKVEGSSGNSCHYLLEMDAAFDAEVFIRSVEESSLIRQVASLRLSGKISNANTWKSVTNRQAIIEQLSSDDEFPVVLTGTKFDLRKDALIRFYLVKRSDGHFAIVFSWHHLLMDGYGATLFLEQLNAENPEFAGKRSKTPVNRKHFLAARKAKKFIDQSAEGQIAALEKQPAKKVHSQIGVLRLSAEENALVKQKSLELKSRFGWGNYLFASAAKVVHELFLPEDPRDLWIPIPQDSRKKKARGPIVGNHLSFLFYRLKSALISDKAATVADLDAQMLSQIRENIPASYGHLMNYLRRVPSGLYYRMIKGPNGATLSSFLYTYAPEHPASLMQIAGGRVQRALNIPPNTYPPGLTFAINTFGDELHIVVLSYTHLCPEEKMERLLTALKTEILEQPS